MNFSKYASNAFTKEEDLLRIDGPRSYLGIAATARRIEHAKGNVESRQTRNKGVKRPNIAYTVWIVIAGGRWDMAYNPNLKTGRERERSGQLKRQNLSWRSNVK